VERPARTNGAFHALSPALNISLCPIQFFQLAGSDERIMAEKNSNCAQYDSYRNLAEGRLEGERLREMSSLHEEKVVSFF
jgi:hypothetical protein